MKSDSVHIGGAKKAFKKRLVAWRWCQVAIFLAAASIFFAACNNESEDIPSVRTGDVTSITKTTAKCGGIISSDGGAPVIERGVCLATHHAPTPDDAKAAGDGTDSFSVTLTGLTMGTTYYARAYATNTAGVGYGDERQFSTQGMVKDADGNSYDTLLIGSQTWMVQNLRTTKFSNGAEIQWVTDNSSWSALNTAAYSELDNNAANVSLYGRLYNFYVTIDDRKVCPAGWRVATDADWTQLTTYLGGTDVAGGKLKANTGWMSPNFGPENRSGFSALPGGYRKADGTYARVFYINGEIMGDFGYWWTSTSYDASNGVARNLYSDLYRIGAAQNDKKQGMSVRCIKGN